MSKLRSLAAAAVFTFSSVARAQTVNLWPGVAPGSEQWTQKEVTYDNTPVGTVIMNVVTPTITAYLPERSKATGAGIVIAPGGGFVALATSQGGIDVARWLQGRGVAAFLLKYRTIEKRGDGIPSMDQDTAARYGIADAIQAIKVVRRHATAWGVSPGRIGIMGFSAGGMVASGALLQRETAGRPNFAALIYGAPFGVLPAIPAGLPPVFMAWAEDDAVARPFMTRLTDAMRAAGTKPDVHVYASGGHGFGIQPRGAPTDQWVDDFAHWLRTLGVTREVESAVVEPMPAALEMRFALSALPPALRDSATVYRLDVKTGYVVARRGTNGVSCLVQRTAWEQADYRDDIYVPRCFDAVGSRTYLRVLIDAEALRIRGMSAAALKSEMEARYRDKRYLAPALAGVSYMLSPVMRTWLDDQVVRTMSGPHVMFYAPNVTDDDIGARPGASRAYPFLTEEGVPEQSYMIQLLGSAERAAIAADGKQLLDDLCAYRAVLCLAQAHAR